jgi:3-hydroxyisobutyrate dehydrogenase-like beta-hydroxyacid dehydrogenase
MAARFAGPRGRRRGTCDHRGVPVVGLLFPGEMGAELGAAADADVVWASKGRSALTVGRAATAGLRDVSTVAALVEASDIVLSVCPPAIAEDVAREVADAGFRALYLEANAISPERAKRIAATLAAAGARAVDGGIIGSTGLNLYLSGEPEDVARIVELFTGTTVTTVALDGGIGAASALKMAYAGWNKIGVGLAAQAHAIARAYGVEDALAAEGVSADRFARSSRKAWRWAPEMEEVAATCAELGLPPETALGAAALFERWSRHRDRGADPETLLDDLLR